MHPFHLELTQESFFCFFYKLKVNQLSTGQESCQFIQLLGCFVLRLIGSKPYIKFYTYMRYNLYIGWDFFTHSPNDPTSQFLLQRWFCTNPCKNLYRRICGSSGLMLTLKGYYFFASINTIWSLYVYQKWLAQLDAWNFWGAPKPTTCTVKHTLFSHPTSRCKDYCTGSGNCHYALWTTPPKIFPNVVSLNPCFTITS